MEEELHLLSLCEALVSTSVWGGGGREGEGKRKEEREGGKERKDRGERTGKKRKKEGRGEGREEGGSGWSGTTAMNVPSVTTSDVSGSCI